jgi:hypothetical protein
MAGENPLSVEARLALSEALVKLPDPQFKQLVFALKLPAGILPSDQAAQGDRVASLLQWAEQSGPGLGEVQELLKRISPPPASDRPDLRMPPLFAYDLDRSIQELELGEKLEQLGLSSPKPVICLIHGNDDECHDKFIDCLKEISLRKLLKLQQNSAPYHVCIPKWPSQLHELDHFNQLYCKSLADEVLQYSRATPQEINDWLTSHPEPVIIEFEFSTHNWEKHALKVISKILEFWQNWPPLAPSQILLVCLCIKYPAERSSPLAKVFGSKPISQVAAAALQALARNQSNQIILAVLSTLEGVTQDDAERWVRVRESNLVTRYGEGVVDALKDTIRSTYERYQSREDPKRIPMKDVADQLRSILRQYSAQESTR